MTPFPDLAPAAPEIFLAISALVLLMLGVFRGDGSTRLICYLTVGVLLVAAVMVLSGPGTREITFRNLFIMDSFGGFMKVLVDRETRLILGAALLCIEGDEIVHSLLDVMAAKAPYTVIQRCMHIHPTVSELIPTLLGSLKPLE